MPTYTKIKLSGVDAGVGNIPVSTSSAKKIHTTGISATILDEVWLWAHNPDANESTLSVYIYSLNDSPFPNGTPISFTVPPYSSILVLGGLPISGSGTTVTDIEVQSILGGTSYVYGFVNRITP